ncbi:MAG: hypothetical protein WC445_01710 [Patescibacteria group bacterium]
MQIVNWLNNNSGFVQAVATLLLVVITAYYAWQTKRTVQLMSKTEEENRRPRIAVFIAQREDWLNLIELVIGNYGNGIARNISFIVDGNLTLFNEKENLNEIEIIKNGLPTLAPQQTIKIPLLSLVGRVDDLQKKDVTISLEYSDHSLEHTYNDKYLMGFKSLVERQLGTPPIYEMAKNIEGINKGVEKISREIERHKN